MNPESFTDRTTEESEDNTDNSVMILKKAFLSTLTQCVLMVNILKTFKSKYRHYIEIIIVLLLVTQYFGYSLSCWHFLFKWLASSLECIEFFLYDSSSPQSVISEMSTIVHECGHFFNLNMSGWGENVYFITDTQSFTCTDGSIPSNGGGVTFSRSLIKNDAYYSSYPSCENTGGSNCDLPRINMYPGCGCCKEKLVCRRTFNNYQLFDEIEY